jgi:hypothetical protein
MNPSKPTISVSLAPIGGLEPLGKRRKVCSRQCEAPALHSSLVTCDFSLLV